MTNCSLLQSLWLTNYAVNRDMSVDRSGFLFGITVSEIAFILFFVLLLFSFVALVKTEQDKRGIETERDQAKESLVEAEKGLANIREVLGVKGELNLDDPLTILKDAADAIKKSEQQEEKRNMCPTTKANRYFRLSFGKMA